MNLCHLLLFTNVKCVNNITFIRGCVTLILQSGLIFVIQYCIVFKSYKVYKAMTNLKELRGNWEEIKKKLKEKFDMLTDSDLLFAEGRQDEMLCRLQTKLGRTKAEVQKILSEL